MGAVAEGARLLEPGIGPGGASLWERPKRRLGEMGRGRDAGRVEGTPAWGGQEGWGRGEENGSFCRFELGVEEIPVPPNQGPTHVCPCLYTHGLAHSHPDLPCVGRNVQDPSRLHGDHVPVTAHTWTRMHVHMPF